MKEKELRAVKCPVCHRKTRVKVYEDTVLLHYPLHSQWCRRTISISVFRFRIMCEVSAL